MAPPARPLLCLLALLVAGGAPEWLLHSEPSPGGHGKQAVRKRGAPQLEYRRLFQQHSCFYSSPHVHQKFGSCQRQVGSHRIYGQAQPASIPRSG